MLQALLHSKLNRDLQRSPFDIEDLLTSTIFGSCYYVNFKEGLLPFLSQCFGNNCSKGLPQKQELSNILSDVVDVKYEFWPNWNSTSTDFSISNNHENCELKGGQPELLLKLIHNNDRESWLLIEAKLGSGKSSVPTLEGAVTDQLGKYWLLLLEKTKVKDCIKPLGILYVTKGVDFPFYEFEETQDELKNKGYPPAKLFWVSWRHFANCKFTEPIMRDVVYLLRERWHLYHVEMENWPKLNTDTLEWIFDPNWVWPKVEPNLFTKDMANSNDLTVKKFDSWSFNPNWTWKLESNLVEWKFKNNLNLEFAK